MDNPIRFTKAPDSIIKQEATTSTDNSASARETKTVQEGKAEVKDSFEIKKESALFTADPAKGTVKFGDGVQGKIPEIGQSRIQASYQSGVGRSGNTGKGSPVDPNTLAQHGLQETSMQTTEDLKSYADKVKHFNSLKKEIRDHLQDLGNYETAEKVANLSAGAPAPQNIMETIYQVLRENIKEMNEDKKYYLNKLQTLNKVSSEIAGQMETISDASRRLATKEKYDDDD
jgi:hypothetical protein